MKRQLLLLLACCQLIFVQKVSAQLIPIDSELKTGKLQNGFTYYIRKNVQPQKHVELYLINKVGSVLEDNDQLGLAHFMEHMNFNGTKNYPKNEMVDFLQKAGIRFGGDLNAYTSFDETVYQLPIPTDDPKMLEKGITIMRDWAHEATLDPNEIDHERGVVLEEKRLGKGAADRMARKYYPLLLNNSRYSDRLPIGTEDILTKFDPAVLRRFHQDWYRPDLQALIVVGDLDPDEVEKIIIKMFSDLSNPAKERTRTKHEVPLTNKGGFVAVTDPENQSLSIEIINKRRADELKTEDDYKKSITKSLLNQMLENRRVAETSKEPSPEYVGLSLGINDFIGGIDMFSLSTTAKAGKLKQAFAQSYRLLERIKQSGFTNEELSRAKESYLRSMTTLVSEKGKIPSSSFVKEYQQLFLNGTAAPGIKWEYDFVKQNIENVNKDQVLSFLKDYLASKDRDIIITAPEKEKNSLPDSSMVASWITELSKEKLTEFVDEKVSAQLLDKKPTPGKIISRKEIASIGATVVEFSNGVKAILKSTDFKNDQILYGAYAYGGTSLFEGDNYTMASNAAGLVSRMGYGNFSKPQLDKVLNGKAINSALNLGGNTFYLRASSASDDIESALQLTYLQFTSPKKDTLTFKNTLSGAIASLANRYADPNRVMADTMSYVLSGYNYRGAAPTEEKLSRINLDRTLDIYKKSFGDASDFTFVFVGNFNTDQLIPLLQRYLGGLPSKGKTKKMKDNGVHIPAGQIIKKVFKGQENKATVSLVYSGNYLYSQQENIQLKALGDILQIKVLQHLREAESQVYSPQVQIQYVKFPQNRFSISISFGCAPENVDKLVSLVSQELKNLRENGPEQGDIEKFKAQYEKGLELSLRDNNFWVNYILSQDESKEDQGQINNIQSVLKNINQGSLKSAAQTFLSEKNRIVFELLPEDKKSM